jgi:DNA-binding NarL/FixJ family response regulator
MKKPIRGAPIAKLTAPQRDVLQFAAFGFTDKEIADRLGINDTAVSARKRLIFRKLDVKSTAHAAALAAGLRLIDPPYPNTIHACRDVAKRRKCK